MSCSAPGFGHSLEFGPGLRLQSVLQSVLLAVPQAELRRLAWPLAPGWLVQLQGAAHAEGLQTMSVSVFGTNMVYCMQQNSSVRYGST